MINTWRGKGALIGFRSVVLASLSLFTGFHAQPPYVANQKNAAPMTAFRLLKPKYIPPPARRHTYHGTQE